MKRIINVATSKYNKYHSKIAKIVSLQNTKHLQK